MSGGEGLDKDADSVMIVTTHPSKGEVKEEETGGGRGESIGGGGIGEEPERDGSDGPGEMEDKNIQEQLDGAKIG